MAYEDTTVGFKLLTSSGAEDECISSLVTGYGWNIKHALYFLYLKVLAGFLWQQEIGSGPLQVVA